MTYHHGFVPRRRVLVYVERDDGLLVFEHRDYPEAGIQVPAGGVHQELPRCLHACRHSEGEASHNRRTPSQLEPR